MASSTRPVALASYAGLLFAGAGFILIFHALYLVVKGRQETAGLD